MVFVDIDPDQSLQLCAYLASRDVLIGNSATVRLVTHLDVDSADIERFTAEVSEFFARAA